MRDCDALLERIFRWLRPDGEPFGFAGGAEWKGAHDWFGRRER